MVSTFRLATWPVFGPKEFAAEAHLELCEVDARGKAENDHVLVIAAQRVRARAERQSFALAKEADREVVVPQAPVRTERDPIRPISIHHRPPELASGIGHSRRRGGRRPRSTLLARDRGEGRFHEAAGGVRSSVAEKEQKGNTNLSGREKAMRAR